MPALQSYWFVPHVIVYIFAYSMMSIATLFSFKGLYQMRKKRWNTQNLNIIDNLVYIGFAFLTFGIIFGAMWAKEAWGHYWSFDPKETWALITWLMYLLYLHYRKFKNQNDRITLIILIIAFLMLLTCWFGVNYLPAAAKSIHVY
jgi:ABC-type transport system involved in cytochrome c biogenesis permease subunit